MRLITYIITVTFIALFASGCAFSSKQSLSGSPKVNSKLFDQTQEPDFATIEHDFRAKPKPKPEPKIQTFPFFNPETPEDDQEIQPTPEKTVTNQTGIAPKATVIELTPKDEPEPSVISKAATSNFTSNELSHIKFSNQKLFTTSNSFVVDLDAEKENCCYPCSGKLISAYGMRGRRMHTGADIKAQHGDRIYAVFDGIVRLAKPYSGYGNVIVLRHNNGLETVYAHNSRNMVKAGDKVKAGDVIALAGRTGTATTEHLHFELRVQGQVLHPGLLLDLANRRIQSGKLIVRKNSSGGISAQRKDGSTVDSQDAPSAPVVPASSSQSATTASKSTASASNSSAVYHTIASGDTLYALALKYKTTVAAICKLNNITPKTVLQLKRKLRLK